MVLTVEEVQRLVREERKSKSDDRVESLISEMTLLEKLGQMTQINAGSMTDPETMRLDPKLIDYYVNERQATLFPHQLGMAATFNRDLVRASAVITAKDTRAIGVHWNFSPILDIAVNKQWPRVYETFGEDPHLVSELGKEMILGYQGYHELHRDDKVAAAMKHFIGYSASLTGKDVDGSWIGERTILEYFRPSFEHAMRVGVETVMESYSDIEGDHLINSKKYLVNLLRDTMRFDGTLVTDFEQINKLHHPIRIATSIRDAVRRVMKLGTVDISMVPNNADFIDHLKDLVESNEIPIELIDQSVRRILTLKSKLGLLDSDGMVDPNHPSLSTLGCQEDNQVSLDSARESIILLQNHHQTLPLKLETNLLVTGPVVDSLIYLTGGWTHAWQGSLDDKFFEGRSTTILQGLKKHGTGKITHLPSVDIDGNSIGSIDDILAASVNHDAIVICLGEPAYTEFKGDINDMYLPKGQLNLLDTLIEKSNKPVILVLSEGRPRVVNPTVKQAHSVLASFLVGPYGGDAISEIIFGKTNPSGKLPITYANHPNDNNLNYYRRRNEIYHDVYWEFGHGLSYTTFEYTNLTLTTPTMTSQSTITATVTITNTGQLPGSETVLFFITDEYRSLSPEFKRLRHFTKLPLQPHESHTVSFTITLESLSFVNLDLNRVAEMGEFTLTVDQLTVPFQLIPMNDEEIVPVPY